VAEFVALAASLLDRDSPAPAAPPDELVQDSSALEDFVDSLALARLAALEAFERAVPRLLAAFAQDVLARELTLAPVDIDRLVAVARKRMAAEEPVAVWVASDDAPRFSCGLPVRCDPALRRGDLVVEVRDGEVDARFALRVAQAIAAALEYS